MFTRLAPVVCIMGGESSGKTTLAQQLMQTLTSDHRLHVSLVPEVLRRWCQRERRAPLSTEQAPIAKEQVQLIREAQRCPDTDIVITDTSALTIAVYSQLYFKDYTLLRNAEQTQHEYAYQLLMGLDLPWVADGLYRDSIEIQVKTDTLLRAALQRADIPFQTIYGTGPSRLTNALRVLSPILSKKRHQIPVETDPSQTLSRSGWVCEGCSDHNCELQMFTTLLKPQLDTLQ